MTEADDQIARNRTELERHPSGDSGRAVALYNLACSLVGKFLETNDIADLEQAIALHQSALDLRPPSDSHRSTSLNGLTVCLSYRYDIQGTIADLEQAITHGRAALQLRPPGHSERFTTLHNLADCLRKKFLKLGANADLDEAISLHQLALVHRPPGRSNWSDSLHDLALCFSYRHDKQGTIADLEQAITLGRATLELSPPGHSGRAMTLYNLACDLRKRFVTSGANDDLNEAISLHRSALDLRPSGHPQRFSSLHDLANCFSYQYDEQGTIADLEQAITLGRAALELHPPDHTDRATALYNLACYLRNRFLNLGANGDLDEAISLHQSALDLRPLGHSKWSDSLHSLAVCFSDRYDKQGTMADLEQAITLGRAALELYSPGHSWRATTLYHLAYCLRKRFLKLGASNDLEEAISLHRSTLNLHPAGHSDRLRSLDQLANCLSTRFEKLLDLHPQGHRNRAKSIDKLLLLVRKRIQKHDMAVALDEYPEHAVPLHTLLIYVTDLVDDEDVSQVVDKIVAIARAALKLCPAGHPDHVMSLTTLAACLRRRFQQQGAVADVDEAVTLYKEALEVSPSGSPASAPHLHGLARCLSERFAKLAMSTDLDDAIKFEQAALLLRPQGHPDHAESLNSLFNCHRLKIKGRGASTQSARLAGTTSGSRFKSLIGDTVFDVLKGFPPRLLDTRTGKLCDRDSQITQFVKSGEYDQLLSSASAMGSPAQVSHIREVVSTYFRYVTLSHRWGKFEPLLRDIHGRVIYDLDPTDGISKLQSFCLACGQRGYLWAWSDTCCIDKESSAELQEAIGSMFSWYRLSALTMVHLSDTSDAGALTNSMWFKRGWTLQELLAPRTMLFFTRDWSLYRDSSSNHKEDGAILGELEQATGITLRHLTDFHPGVDDARSRLQWASTRCTTRPEDIAYSLLGVFSLHIPVLYGESAENALGRLLAEVVSKSGDTSILDWVGPSSVFHSCFPATITPYQTLPLSLPVLTTPPSTCTNCKHSLIDARKMHQALSDLPLAKFANFRLILPCIVHRIEHMALTQVDTSTAAHVHQIHAVGLAPIDIALSERLENAAKRVPYILIRPWHPNLLHPAIDADDASTHQWLTLLEQPFSALLLMELPHNEYRRVASFCHIIARPTDSTGVLKGEVNTLTII